MLPRLESQTARTSVCINNVLQGKYEKLELVSDEIKNQIKVLLKHASIKLLITFVSSYHSYRNQPTGI